MSDVRRRALWLVHLVVGTTLIARSGAVTRPGLRRDERGLSQSTEQAIMIAGAVAIAIIIVTFVTTYVQGQLNKAGG